MKITKDNLISALFAYVGSEVVMKIPDHGLKVITGTAVFAAKSNPTFIDNYIFSNPLVCSLLCESNGTYDVDGILNALKQSIQNFGKLELSIPKIPMVTNGEKKLIFGEDDVDTLRTYIERGVNDGD